MDSSNFPLDSGSEPNDSNGFGISEAARQAEMWASLRCATEFISTSMTVASGLELLVSISANKESLPLHNVVAAVLDFVRMRILEDLLHLYPQVRACNIVLIGLAPGDKRLR